MLESYITKVSSLNINRAPTVNVLEPVTIDYARNEAKILNAFVKQNVESIIEEYQFEVQDQANNKFAFLYAFELLYFLDLIPDWYEKVIERENVEKLEANNKHTL